MIKTFYKYHGTGNDFVLFDNRDEVLPREAPALYEGICHRRFGIGADGVILIQNHPIAGVDFEMVYFNSDGRPSSMCGNGGRCVVAFAKQLGIIQTQTTFLAIDGWHDAQIAEDGQVHLKMSDVDGVEEGEGYWLLNTGSPHYVCFVDDVDAVKIIPQAHAVRYNDRFKERGVNVNFIQPEGAGLYMRTYERGVEDETYSCGTGAVAAALCKMLEQPGLQEVPIRTKGGSLSVKAQFEVKSKGFREVWLIGPAQYVFDGAIDLKW